MVSGLFSSARPTVVNTIVKTAACNNDCKLMIFMKGPRYISCHVGLAHHNPMGVSIVTTAENGLNCYVEPADAFKMASSIPAIANKTGCE